jgi:hypothetical protein
MPAGQMAAPDHKASPQLNRCQSSAKRAIETAAEKMGQPLTDLEQAAIDMIARQTLDPAMRLSFGR